MANWRPEYALPAYLRSEEFYGTPMQRAAARRAHGISALGDYYVSALGDSPSARGDPIRAYGQVMAGTIVSVAKRYQGADRSRLIDQALDRIDGAAKPKVHALLARFRGQGVPPEEALQRAIAGSLSDGFMREIGDLARNPRKHVKANSPLALAGFGPLGATGKSHSAGATAAKPRTAEQQAEKEAYWSQPKDVIATDIQKKMMEAAYKRRESRDRRTAPNGHPIHGGVNAMTAKDRGTWQQKQAKDEKIRTGRLPFTSVKYKDTTLYKYYNQDEDGIMISRVNTAPKKGWWEKAWDTVTDPKTLIGAATGGVAGAVVGAIWGDEIAAGAKKVGNAVKDGVEAIVEAGKDLACAALNSGAGQAAITAGAGAYGVPPQATQVGISMGKQICGSGTPPPPPPPESNMGTIALVGGAGVLAYLLFL